MCRCYRQRWRGRIRGWNTPLLNSSWSNRERNAKKQLDKALSLHARLLGVRKKYESELEQSVADLGSALVVAKSKVEKKLEADTSSSSNITFGDN